MQFCVSERLTPFQGQSSHTPTKLSSPFANFFRVPTSALGKGGGLQVKEPQEHFSKLPHVVGELGLTRYLTVRDWRVVEAMLRAVTFKTRECRITAGRLMRDCEITHRKQLERSQRKIVALGIFKRAGVTYWGSIPIRRFYQCNEREIVTHVENGCREGHFPTWVRQRLEAWKYAQELRQQRQAVTVDTEDILALNQPEPVYKAAYTKRTIWDELLAAQGWR